MSVDLPTDPKAVKKMEKAIAKGARADEQDYKHALKELERTEKSQARAAKAASKADKDLKKMEAREYDTIRSLQKATHVHDQAVANLHTAQSDVQIHRQQAQRLKQVADTLQVRAGELLKAKQAREEERSVTLASIHSQPPATTG